MEYEVTRSGSRAHTPDLDWSQVRETVLMLELAAGQVEAAMRDSNSSVEVLGETFTSLADSLKLIETAIESLPDAAGGARVKAEILGNTQLVTSKVNHAIMAFQFYDKLAQRLDHVCHGLSGLAGLVSDQRRLYNPSEWKALQEQILTKYTMAEERTMFASVLNGGSVKEALETYMHARMEEINSSGGDIELF